MTTRLEIRIEAEKLIRGGISRRKMDAILKERYGRSVGKATHSRLFQERVQQITERDATRPVGYKTPKTKRGARYNWLREHHFNHDEAQRLSHLRKLKGSEGVQRMAIERLQLWTRFTRKAAQNGWAEAKRRKEWRRYLARWYRSMGYVTKGKRKAKKGTPSVWVWYNDIQHNLPPDLQDGTPRLHKRPPQAPVTTHRITRSAQLNNLRRTLRDAPDQRKPQIRQWIKDLEGKRYG